MGSGGWGLEDGLQGMPSPEQQSGGLWEGEKAWKRAHECCACARRLSQGHGAAGVFARPLDGNTGWLRGSTEHTPEWRRDPGSPSGTGKGCASRAGGGGWALGVEPECPGAREPAPEPARRGGRALRTLLIAGI